VIDLNSINVVRDGRSIFDRPISLRISPGDIAVIMGASGSGKTTLLDSVRGSVEYTGTVTGTNRIFSVYQGDNQLFPWYTIRKNFELARCSDSWIETSMKWKIDHLADRLPGEMSGGQRQRFVLLRALSRDADLLLCDEPLNHLDMLSSKIIAKDFRETIKKQGTTAIWVTHDLVEARLLADQCYMLTQKGLVEINHQDLDIDYVSKLLDE
jgi:ABC-type nitrate/sulfonate/bicarbonate transport system ATPase subunit